MLTWSFDQQSAIEFNTSSVQKTIFLYVAIAELNIINLYSNARSNLASFISSYYYSLFWKLEFSNFFTFPILVLFILILFQIQSISQQHIHSLSYRSNRVNSSQSFDPTLMPIGPERSSFLDLKQASKGKKSL